MQNSDGIEQESVSEMLDKTIITASNIPPKRDMRYAHRTLELEAQCKELTPRLQ
jgi:hypothetical protein